jgi:derlin-1
MDLSAPFVWCQLNKYITVRFWFGSQFTIMYLPWVLFAFNLTISGGGIMELVGTLFGYLYFNVLFKYPLEFGGPALFSTPSIIYNFFPNQKEGVRGIRQPPASRFPANDGRGHNWGRGHVFGDY